MAFLGSKVICCDTYSPIDTELGVTLTEGNTYQFQFWAACNIIEKASAPVDGDFGFQIVDLRPVTYMHQGNTLYINTRGKKVPVTCSEAQN